MYLFLKYTVIIILSYQCTTHGIILGKLKKMFGFGGSKSAENHCVVFIPMNETYFMPIPYELNVTGPAIITPDKDGHLFVGHKRRFRFSCSGGTFVSPTECVGLAEVTVECLNGTVLGYKRKRYEFDMFRCDALPRAKLTAANASCNGIVNGVFDVGFYTAEPLTLYKVCFDAGLKRALYSWYYADAPVMDIIQKPRTEPRFVKTEHFKSLDMADVYRLKRQTEPASFGGMTVNRTVYNGKIRSYVPSHLITRNQFFYSFQQFATYFYENTAPVWSACSYGIWNEVDLISLINLHEEKGKHLVITGTINSTHLLQTRTAAPMPFEHQWLNGLPVPHSIWRMVYGVESKFGVVYIGLNTPNYSGDPKKHFCEKIPCPGEFGLQITIMNLVYCCTKESFEKVYGPLDPVVYKEF